uniref:Ubiquitin carboxyl-terminal hydrolase MINDY n=1 Tax=Cyclopterus lumpus TaxID=8103 RepID=A0A8C3B247_CYCLU
TMAVSVEEASSSVVREYLSRKGLRRTIACMDEELPRTESSVNNRSHLRQILNMEGLYRKNKVSRAAGGWLLCKWVTFKEKSAAHLSLSVSLQAQLSPLKTLLEIIVKSDIGEICPSQPMHTSLLPETDRLSSQNKTGFRSHHSEDHKLQPLIASVQDNESFIRRESEKKTSTTESTQRSKMNRIRRGMIAGPIASTLQIFGLFSVLVLLQELKVILIGSSLNCFNVEWRNQGFPFSEMHDLRYGIVQKKGGPCGVLASIQAFVLKKLLFENVESSNTGLQRLRPSNTTRRKCLALAAAEILWRAGEEKQATIAINSGRNHFTPTGQYKSEGVLEKVERCNTHLLTDKHSSTVFY